MSRKRNSYNENFKKVTIHLARVQGMNIKDASETIKIHPDSLHK